MKLFGFLFFMSSAVSALVHKEFVQVYSNYYIQSTNEVDWKCITVNVTQDQHSLNVTKNGYLHGIKGSPVHDTTHYVIGDDDRFVSEKETLIRRIENKDYVVWTGINNLTLYVWAKDYDDFIENYDTDVKQYLKTLNYTGTYKSPVLSFTQKCV